MEKRLYISGNSILIEFNEAEEVQTAAQEDVLEISKRLIAKNREAYEVLAK